MVSMRKLSEDAERLLCSLAEKESEDGSLRPCEIDAKLCKEFGVQ